MRELVGDCPQEGLPQRVPAFQDPADGAHRGRRVAPSLPQRRVDGLRADLAEVAGLLQLDAQTEHQVLHRARGPIARGTRAAGPVRPVHAVQPFCPGSPSPEEDRGRDDLEFPGSLPEGRPATNQRHHFPTTLLSLVFLAMAVSLREWLTAMLLTRMLFDNC